MTPDRLLTSKEAAALSGYSVRTLYREVARGRLTYVKLGGLTRFRQSAIERYLRTLPERGRVA